MKMTSRVSRAVRRAARSPARSMMGPAVALIGDSELGGDDVGEGRLAHARAGRRGGRGRGPRRGSWPPRWRPAGSPPPGAGPRIRRGRAGGATGRSRRRRRSARAETMRGSVTGVPCAHRAPPETICSARRRRSSKRPVAVLAQRAVDAALRLRPRVAEVGERGEEVFLRAWRRRRASASGPPGRHRRHLVLQLDDQPLRRLLADPGHAREARDVAPAQGGRELRGLDPGEDVHGQLGADAGHLDEALEQVLLVRGEEAEEGERVLAHVGVHAQADLASLRRPGGRRCVTGMATR